jgi:hypothetical protein
MILALAFKGLNSGSAHVTIFVIMLKVEVTTKIAVATLISFHLLSTLDFPGRWTIRNSQGSANSPNTSARMSNPFHEARSSLLNPAFVKSAAN